MKKKPVSKPVIVSIVVFLFLSLTISLDSCKARKAKKAEKERADSAAAAQGRADEMTVDSDWLIDSMNNAEMLKQKYDSIDRAADSIRRADSIAAARDLERMMRLRDSTRIADSIANSKKKPK